MMSKVEKNEPALAQWVRSMQVALDKAERGSTVEDGYFLEKLEKITSIMGYKLTPKD